MRPKRHKWLRLAVLLAGTVLCTACAESILRDSLQDHHLLPQNSWSASQPISFTFSSSDSLAPCLVWLDLRVNRDYTLPYICVKITPPTANSRRYWLYLKDGQGKGKGLVTDYRFALDPFDPRGIASPQTWVLSQATSKEPLSGIVSVGLCLKTHTGTSTK